MRLSDFSIKNAKPKPKPYKLSDFDGLYLYVTPSGSRLWRDDYRFAGKRPQARQGRPKRMLASPGCDESNSR